MPRIKRGTIKHKKRERILKQTKGFKWGRKNLKRRAKEALLHAWSHAYVGRKKKKRDFRRLWNVKINAAARKHELSYSKFMSLLKESDIKLDRKTLAYLAEHEPEEFDGIVKKANRLDSSGK